MVRDQQAGVLFHTGHQQNKNNDKIKYISNSGNEKAQTHAQIPAKTTLQNWYSK